MGVSRRLQETVDAAATGDTVNAELVEQARTELYRGQCNCGYWHGAFGGVYLPHLRNAVYQHLIAADNLLDRISGRMTGWIEATAADYNFDTRQEVQLANDRMVALLAPSCGGQLYELDVRSICHNLLATLARRPEAYHRKVLAGAGGDQGQVSSIHDRVVFKQQGLEQRIQYDDHLRKSLLDCFYGNDATLEAVASGQAQQQGDFLNGAYEARIRRNPDRIQVQMVRDGHALGHSIRITKGVTLAASSSILEIAYLLEGLPPNQPLHFAVELNFAGLPSGADDRYFYDANHNRLGQLGNKLNLVDVQELGLVDEWLGIDVALRAGAPTSFWTYPIETVSQSESGFELVHQSVVVQPHWYVLPDNQGRWSVTMQMVVDTHRAEQRQAEIPAVAAAT